MGSPSAKAPCTYLSFRFSDIRVSKDWVVLHVLSRGTVSVRLWTVELVSNDGGWRAVLWSPGPCL